MCIFFIFKTEDQDTHRIIARFRRSARRQYPGFFTPSREFTHDEMLHPDPQIFLAAQEPTNEPPPNYSPLSELTTQSNTPEQIGVIAHEPIEYSLTSEEERVIGRP